MATEFCPSGITAKVTRFKTILPHLIAFFVVGLQFGWFELCPSLALCQRPVADWRSTAPANRSFKSASHPLDGMASSSSTRTVSKHHSCPWPCRQMSLRSSAVTQR